MKLEVVARSYRLRHAFAISRGSRTAADVIEVRIEESGHFGRGECVPYKRYGESMSSVMEQISSVPLPVRRRELQHMLPHGAARNAIDCALWDLEAKRTDRPVWEIAGLREPRPVMTAYTISLDTPQAMRESAQANRHRPLLKVKLGQEGNQVRIHAVREGAPDARIIVDANEAWTVRELESSIESCREARVEMIEQPLPASGDGPLSDLMTDMVICADESCHDRNSLQHLPDGYSMVNVKLDKAGGLTEALELVRYARSKNLDIMIGCMIGSSLAMAPAMLLAQQAKYVDLDGPLHMIDDIGNGLAYTDSLVFPAGSELWG